MATEETTTEGEEITIEQTYRDPHDLREAFVNDEIDAEQLERGLEQVGVRPAVEDDETEASVLDRLATVEFPQIRLVMATGFLMGAMALQVLAALAAGLNGVGELSATATENIATVLLLLSLMTAFFAASSVDQMVDRYGGAVEPIHYLRPLVAIPFVYLLAGSPLTLAVRDALSADVVTGILQVADVLALAVGLMVVAGLLEDTSLGHSLQERVASWAKRQVDR